MQPFSPRIVRILGESTRRGWRGRYKNALRGSGSGKGLNDEACCRVSTATAHNSVLHGPLRRKKKRPPVPELLDAIASKWVPMHRATVCAQDRQLYHTQRASRGLRFRLWFVAFKVAFEVAALRLYPCPRVHRRLATAKGDNYSCAGGSIYRGISPIGWLVCSTTMLIAGATIPSPGFAQL